MTKNALSFKQPKLLNKTSVLDFGQYKNNSVGEIMEFDASYLVWLIEKEIIRVEAWLYDDISMLADSEERDRQMELYLDHEDFIYGFDD